MGARIGMPSMPQVPRMLARKLDVAQGATVTSVLRDGGEWVLRKDSSNFRADLLVLAIPAPQARDLLGPTHSLDPDLERVGFHASVTVMVGLDPEAPRPFVTQKGEGARAWVVQDSAKPGREGQPLTAWVVQADPEWSRAYIVLPVARLADLVAPRLLQLLGALDDHVRYQAAHRWLYAQASRPLGQPFLANDDAGLVVGGDRGLGPMAEDGWASGRTRADHLLARL
ncbi:MAG: hypothetical protein FJX25_08445 [Alphaproteobacteria bacterium]|nr:hypothetical protein [Alphaproteobacteria bacterium]